MIFNIYYRVRSCVINGIKYTRDSVIVLDMEDDLPSFGRIIEFIITPLHCLIIFYPVTTQTYNYHFHAYEVIVTEETCVCSSDQLFDYHPLVCAKPVGYNGRVSLFVSLKYHLFQ